MHLTMHTGSIIPSPYIRVSSKKEIKLKYKRCFCIRCKDIIHRNLMKLSHHKLHLYGKTINLYAIQFRGLDLAVDLLKCASFYGYQYNDLDTSNFSYHCESNQHRSMSHVCSLFLFNVVMLRNIKE